MGVRGRARDTQKPAVKCLFFYIDPVSGVGPRFGYLCPRILVPLVWATALNRVEDLALVDCALADGRGDRLDRLQDH